MSLEVQGFKLLVKNEMKLRVGLNRDNWWNRNLLIKGIRTKCYVKIKGQTDKYSKTMSEKEGITGSDILIRFEPESGIRV